MQSKSEKSITCIVRQVLVYWIDTLPLKSGRRNLDDAAPVTKREGSVAPCSVSAGKWGESISASW